MSSYLEYFNTIERMLSVEPRVLATTIGPRRAEFVRRRWVVPDGYLTRVMVPFFDSEEEVEADIDEDAGVFRYRSPQFRSRIVTRPLSDIMLYALRIDTWLTDLCNLIGIEPRQQSPQRTRVPDHLWHLGNARIAGTHDFAPVFVGRLWKRAPAAETTQTLCDTAWPRGGVLLRHRSGSDSLPRDHVMRALNEFVRVDDGEEVFDKSAFDRVLRSFASPTGEPEPVQFFQGKRLKLPHFSNSRELSDERAKIIKGMWGVEGTLAPEMSWIDVNQFARTGYQSFDDAFGGKALREDFIAKVSHGKYRLRRNT